MSHAKDFGLVVRLCITLKFGAPICIFFGDTLTRGISQARDEILRMSGSHQVSVFSRVPCWIFM